MLLKKEGFPEEDELVLCTVTNVQHHSVFAILDEYDKTGLIHISEVSAGRIRNIRDFVVEGKKVVCKVLRINQEKGHIDLTLRRVTESQKRAKINAIKQEQKAEKIVETVAKKLNLDITKLYAQIAASVFKKYPSLYSFFENVIKDDSILKDLGISEGALKELGEAIKSRIKETIVEVSGNLKLKSYAPNGLEIIKETLKKVGSMGKEKTIFRYEGGGKYKFAVKAPDYKEAEKILNSITNAVVSDIEKQGGEGTFTRIK